MSEVRPFTPDEALAAKVHVIPPFVVEAVNMLLAKHFDGKSARVEQREIIKLAVEIGEHNETLPPGTTAETFFSEKWLDFEKLYEKSGWKVRYDKPGWDETYSPFFVFEKK